MFDDRPAWLETIDELVPETRQELDELHSRFMVDGVCRCPLCKSLEATGEERSYGKMFRRSWWQKALRRNHKK